MTNKWPKFITIDLGDSDEDAQEMERRWSEYDRRMKEIITDGGVHQDEDGWWVHTKSGELIGPDPEMERPLRNEDISKMKPIAEINPELTEKLRRGRPPLEVTKISTTIRLNPLVIAKLKEGGAKGWQTRLNETLEKALGI